MGENIRSYTAISAIHSVDSNSADSNSADSNSAIQIVWIPVALFEYLLIKYSNSADFLHNLDAS